MSVLSRAWLHNPAIPLVATRIEAIMSRMLTFRELKSKKGWPHSRQYTTTLVKAGKVPPPRKRLGGGSINLWVESEWDQFQSTFAADVTLTAASIDVLTATTTDAIIAAVNRLRSAIEHEGAVPSDIIVTLRHDDRDAHDHDDHDVHGAEAGSDQ
jgi:hypothetical protein